MQNDDFVICITNVKMVLSTSFSSETVKRWPDHIFEPYIKKNYIIELIYSSINGYKYNHHNQLKKFKCVNSEYDKDINIR